MNPRDYAAQAQSNSSSPPAAPATALDQTILRLNNIRDQAVNITDRLTGVLARAFGPVPSDTKSAASDPVPSGAIGSLEGRLREIESLISFAHGLVDSLDTLV